MNKISVDKSVNLIHEDNKMVMNINKNSKIDFNDYECNELICNIEENVEVFFIDINSNIQKYIFNCMKNSNIEINKFNSNDISYSININLYENSSSKLVISTIANNANNVDINVKHIGEKTYSKCINNGVVKNGSILYNVKGIIEKGSINSTVLQESKIITKDVKNATIKPILIINETPEEANHSASIGYYNEDELFYLESRGIEKKQAIELLNKGLLTSNFRYKEKIENLI